MDKFTPRHLCFVLLGIAIVSMKTYPTLFTRLGGRDTWIAMIIASFTALFYLMFMLSVFKKSQYQSFASIYEAALGKKVGRFFLFLYIINLFMILLESSSVEASAMHTNMLLETRQWALVLFLTIASLYSVKRGKAAIMTATIIAITLICISGVNLAIFTSTYKHIDYLKPILKDGVTKGLVTSMFLLLGAYGNVAIIFPYLSDLSTKKKVNKYLTLAMIFIIQIEIVSMSGIIMTFEMSFLNTMIYPKLLQTQLIGQFPFIEFGEVFVMLQIVGGWFVKYILTFYAIVQMLESLNIKIKNFIYYLTAITIILSSYLSSNLFRLFRYLYWLNWVNLVSLLIIPFLIFVIYLIRGKKQDDDADYSQ